MDSTWKIPGRRILVPQLQRCADEVAAKYEGVSVSIEHEEKDFATAFFSVPNGDEALEIEVTLYEMGGKDGLVLSLEVDAGDNDTVWDDACQLAEDLADALEGESVDLW